MLFAGLASAASASSAAGTDYGGVADPSATGVVACVFDVGRVRVGWRFAVLDLTSISAASMMISVAWLS